MSARHAGARRRLMALGAGALLGLGGLFVPAAMSAESAGPVDSAVPADSGRQASSDSGFGADASTYLSDAVLAASTSEATNSTPHCAVSLTPDQREETPDQKPGASGATEQRCFAQFADAVAYGTGGDLRPSSGTGPEALDMSSAEVKASSLLSIMYNHRSYDGASKILMGSGRGCYAGRTYSIDDLGKVGWDNRANSVKMHSNCLGRFYAGKNQRGDRFLCVGNCSSLGDMNNRPTSTKFF